MKYRITLDPNVLSDIDKHIKAGNKKLVVKINLLISELSEHPRNGTGKPEQLKGYSKELWSRRIDGKHRLVYQIIEEELVVLALAAYGHYGDK